MRIDRVSQDLQSRTCALLAERARQVGELEVKYIDLGLRVIRLECHSPKFMTHVERQMSISLRDNADSWDATLVVWQDNDVSEIAWSIWKEADPEQYKQMRLKKITNPETAKELVLDGLLFYRESLILYWPLLNVDPKRGYLTAWEPEGNTYYYAEENLDPEEFIKRGHIFVHILFRICNIPDCSLAHGGVIGLNGQGVLLCAYGYRGKSTLCVRALLDGFEYVTDDYVILGKKQGEPLKSWPIYSIVALAPNAYDALYNDFEGKFISMNARKDKYMFNIEKYHTSFRTAYPIKFAMFPNICSRPEPAIVPGARELAIQELCFSLLNNTGFHKDAVTVGKLFDFIKDLPFYHFDLCPDSRKNAACLARFLENPPQ